MNEGLTLREYQEQAIRTDRIDGKSIQSLMVHLLGLAGEAGSLLSEYKKWIREGERYKPFTDQVSEEIGDILWYLAAISSRAGLDLQEVAHENLAKLADRWPAGDTSALLFGEEYDRYDASFPGNEQLPRTIRLEFKEVEHEAGAKLEIRDESGELIGDPLTDNAHSNDGYRFHDVFHFANAINLGWSPVIRSLLRRKRKSVPQVDEVEDGARAAITEEAISVAVFAHAKEHSFFEGMDSVDYELLRIIQLMTRPFEVRDRSLRDWEHSILEGYKIWRSMNKNNGGILVGDAGSRTISYEPLTK